MASPEEEVVEVQAEVVAEAAAEQPEVADFPGSLDLPEQIREEVSAEDLLPDEATDDEKVDQMSLGDAELKAVLEAIIYVTDEPLSLEQICAALLQPQDRVMGLLDQLAEDYERADRGLSIKEIAGGYKMATKPEHHEAVRRFVKNLNPPLKLSLPALETLAVIAYKQPITAPEIMEIRGVQGAGVLKTLVERRLIATAGRKAVIGKPILYKTTREFLVQFGLRDLAELPTLKEFQELARFDTEPAAVEPEPAPAPVATEDPAETPAPAVQDPPVEFET
jgi:segregation and condensation protein B